MLMLTAEYEPTATIVSADSHHVGFISAASNLVAGITYTNGYGNDNIFERDLVQEMLPRVHDLTRAVPGASSLRQVAAELSKRSPGGAGWSVIGGAGEAGAGAQCFALAAPDLRSDRRVDVGDVRNGRTAQWAILARLEKPRASTSPSRRASSRRRKAGTHACGRTALPGRSRRRRLSQTGTGRRKYRRPFDQIAARGVLSAALPTMPQFR